MLHSKTKKESKKAKKTRNQTINNKYTTKKRQLRYSL